MECDYEECERPAVSCGNHLYDKDGEDWEICICQFHLDKFLSGHEGYTPIKESPKLDASPLASLDNESSPSLAECPDCGATLSPTGECYDDMCEYAHRGIASRRSEDGEP